MTRALLVAALLAGCSTPDLKIIYEVADGTTGPTCGSSECANVPMKCDSVLHVRVLRPSDPTAPFISVCEEVPQNSNRDLCAISQIDLPATTLPRETLEVQVVVWPKDAIKDDLTGRPDCSKIPVEFDATMGFPMAAGSVQPAFGGRAYYHPGDSETFVTLGCVDLPAINAPTCDGSNDVQISATVGDFENLPFSVSPTVGDRLLVAVGEPKPFDDGVRTGHELNTAQVVALDRTVVGPTPVWGGGVDLMFQSAACALVTEDGAQTTSTLRCSPAKPGDKMLDIPGVRLPKGSLDQVLNALSLSSFPEQGLTIGIVLDHVGNPAPGFTVSATGGNVQYLSSDRSMPFADKTSDSGIFVSTDAPFGTIFSAFQVNQVVTGIGGLVDGKVTVVVLQFDMPPGS